MAITLALYSGDNVTLTDTETSLMVDGGSTTLQTITTAGFYGLKLDMVATLAKVDEFTIRFYEKARSTGTKRVFDTLKLRHGMSSILIVPPILLGVGSDITAQRTAGSNRAAYWTVYQVS